MRSVMRQLFCVQHRGLKTSLPRPERTFTYADAVPDSVPRLALAGFSPALSSRNREAP